MAFWNTKKPQTPPEPDIRTYEAEPPHYEPVEHPPRFRYALSTDGVYRKPALRQDKALLSCVGDMLAEEKLYKSHLIGGRTDFHDVFTFVRPYFAASDLTVGNLETMLCAAAPYTGEQYKVDGKYHCNAPQSFLGAVRQAGFDFLMLANNHNLDCGAAGIRETLNRIDDAGLMRTGLFAGPAERRFALVEVNGIRLALLSWSTWYNRNETRLTDEGRRALLNEYAPDRAASDIAAARAAGAEFVLTYIHWGVDAEYKTEPSASMRRMAQELADAGADYIVGSHTHSVQPHDLITARDGRIVPVAWSMGNFVTSELMSVSRSTGILQIELTRQNGKVRVTGETFIPCYIPDSACGLSYPVLPERSITGEGKQAMQMKEAIKKVKGIFTKNGNMTGEWILTKKHICAALGLPAPAADEVYTKLNFAMDARPGCVALVSDITSDKNYRTPREKLPELAETAMQKGAKLLLATEQIGDYPCMVVDDTFQAYARIVRACRACYTPKTISITGSIGKTTATELIYTVVSSKFNTHRNTGSANNFRYCGSVVQDLKQEHQVYVQELMEGPPYGAAASIAQLVRPDIAVMTLVGTSHMEIFGSQQRIWESCLGVQEGMPADGVLILNGDDPFQRNAEIKDRKALYYGIADERADYRAVNIKNLEMGMSFDVQHDGTVTPVVLHCFGQHNILYALAAFAAGKLIGMTDKEVTDGIARYRTSGIRQNLVSYGGVRLYLDCYNASVESMQSALTTVSAIPVNGQGRRIAVLADIKEGGADVVEYHRQVGRAAAASQFNALFCYGDDARYIAEEARANAALDVHYFPTKAELTDALRAYIREQDLLLFKGSHSMELEDVVDKLFGTWYHEEFERYDFKTREFKTKDLAFRLYTDHAVVTKKLTTVADVEIPACVEELPVTGIERSVFSGSKYTESVTFPDTLTNIRYCAFYKANKLKTVSTPPSVRIIDNSAFSTCANLCTVEIAEGCTHLGYRAFGNCKALEKITIPATVRQIGGECFLNCEKLTIHGKAGSYAEQYARGHSIPFCAE
jgi:UDP-N-acetylmuramoyl-tripeptide--D-alanyl-D-alanine ligase